MNQQKLEKLQSVLKQIDQDFASTEEVAKIVSVIIKEIKSIKGSISGLSTEFSQELNKLINDHKSLSKKGDYSASYLMKELDSLKSALSNLKLKHGQDGQDGKDYVLTKSDLMKIADQVYIPDNTNVVAEKVLNTIVIPEEDCESIVHKINQGDKLIKKERIEGLDDIERIAKANASNHKTYTGVTETRVKELINQNDASNDTLQGVTDRGATTTNEITLPGIQAKTSAGLAIKADNGDTAVLIGAGGGKNATFYDGVKLDAQTASRVVLFDANKNLVSSTLTSTALEAIPTTYCPYTGATGAVNLGAQNLSTTGTGTFSQYKGITQYVPVTGTLTISIAYYYSGYDATYITPVEDPSGLPAIWVDPTDYRIHWLTGDFAGTYTEIDYFSSDDFFQAAGDLSGTEGDTFEIVLLTTKAYLPDGVLTTDLEADSVLTKALTLKTIQFQVSDDGTSLFVGDGAGYNAQTVTYCNYFGKYAGYTATGSNYSNFFGSEAGSEATQATYCNFFGWEAGDSAKTLSDSNFLGRRAGIGASNSSYSNFFGYGAGAMAIATSGSNFFGNGTGSGASSASMSNFFGYNSGVGASNSSYSNFLGFYAGYGQKFAARCIFLGTNAGNNNGQLNQTDFANNLIIDQGLSTSNAPRATAAAIRTNALLYGTFADAAASQQLTINAGTVNFNGGTNTDITFNFTGTTNSGVLYWMEDEDYFKFNDDIFINDAENIVLGTTTGTKFGTATTQKLSFYNSTPIVQPSGNALTALSNLGLVASPTLTKTDVGLANVTNNAQLPLAGGTMTGTIFSQDIQPKTDDTYYLGKNDDDTPLAYKGVILKDQAGTGKYYRLEVYNDALRIVDLSD